MTDLPVTERRTQGPYTVWLRPDEEIEPILASIRTPGQILKQSAKATTWKSGHWAIKQSGAGPRAMLKETTAGHQRRQAFDAALYLEAHNIPAPRAVAYVEKRAAGLVVRHWVVTEFLNDCVDVEAFLDSMIASKPNNTEITNYLSGIADAVNRLVKSGAQHRDLAGKNILTHDGKTFYFIDLDAVVIGRSYSNEDRLKNHVQLYDSFCDDINDTFLEAFIAKMGATTHNIAMYMGAVKKAQKRRRAHTESVRRKQGKPK